MRILFVTRTLNPAWGGPVQGFKNLSQQAQKRGWTAEVVTVDDPSAAWLPSMHLPVHAVGEGALGMFGFSRQLDRWLDVNIANFDAVVVHSVWMYFSFAVWKAARRHGVPYYLFIHGALDPWFQQFYPRKLLKKKLYWRLVEHKVLRDARAVLFTTEEEKRLADHAFEPYECNPVVVGYGIVSPPGSKSTPDRAGALLDMTASHPELKGRRFFLYLARIHEKKGIDLLLHSWSEMASQLGNTALVLAGPGDPATVTQFKDLANQLGLGGRVVWTGPLYEEQKWTAMRAAECYILPSHQENFGISVVEALACHTPVLISNKVNIWREVETDGAGLVEPDTVEGTYRLMSRWLALDSNAQGRMREQARACFEQHFDVDSNSRIFLDLLESGGQPQRQPEAIASA